MNTVCSAMLLAVAAAVATCGCTDHRTESKITRSSATTAPSIYPVGVALRDEYGAAIGVDVFRGRPVIVSMFYGSCPAACPMLVTHIKRIEASLPPAVRASTRVLLVSFDPERDTPEALRALADKHRVDASRWRLASGTDDGVRELANALGIRYRKGPGGVFAHDSVIAVLDEEGRGVARADELDADLDPLVDAIASMAHGS